MKVLLVEDDVEIAELTARALRREGYLVDVEHDGEAGLDAALIGGYGAIVLDIMMPGRNGLAVCRDLRRERINVPILMLTARDAIEDRVKGLDEGADDYLVKPFDPRELAARIRALVRRDQALKTGVLQIADLKIDTKTRRVERASGEIHLTPREYSLLEALARNVGRTLTREVILEQVWDAEESTEGAVNFHVTSLRRKLDADREPKLIHTVHGLGYMLKGDA